LQPWIALIGLPLKISSGFFILAIFFWVFRRLQAYYKHTIILGDKCFGRLQAYEKPLLVLGDYKPTKNLCY
jgi:hypothetical protein